MKDRRLRWHAPTEQDLRPLFWPSSTPVGNSAASEPHGVVHGGGRSAYLDVEPDELLTAVELWDRMGRRGGFYIRKWFWRPSTRFLVASMQEDRNDPGKTVLVGSLCNEVGTQSICLGQALDEPVWQLVGITARRRREDQEQ